MKGEREKEDKKGRGVEEEENMMDVRFALK